MGRQWSSSYEIDIAAINPDFKLVALGECKWSNKKVGMTELRNLQEKVKNHALPVSQDCKYFLFSKSGYTVELERYATENRNIILSSGLEF